MEFYTFNKKRRIILSALYLAVMLAVWIYCAVKIFSQTTDAMGKFGYIILFLFVTITLTAALLVQRKWGTDKDRVTIDEKGIEYRNQKHNYFIKWENVGQVYIPQKYQLRIHIFDEAISDKMDEYGSHQACGNSGICTIDEFHIFLSYSCDAYKIIKEHYKKQIKGEHYLAIRGKYVE